MACAKSAATKRDIKPQEREQAPEKATEQNYQPHTEPEERLDQLNKTIEFLQLDQAEIIGKIQKLSSWQSEYQTQREFFKQDICKLSDRMHDIQRRREQVRQQYQLQKSLFDRRAEFSKMKKAIGYTSENDIDRRIEAIKFHMMHEVISLRQEKQLMREIAYLKKQRSQVRDWRANLQDKQGVQLREQIASLSEEITMCFAERQRVSEQLQELDCNIAKQNGHMAQLIDRRQRGSKQLQEYIKESYNIQQHRSAEQEEVLRTKPESAAEQVSKETQASSHEPTVPNLQSKSHVDIELIKQCIIYCKKQVGQFTETEAKDLVKVAAYDVPENHKVLVSKAEREEMYCAPTKVKKSRSKAKGSSKDSAKLIKHNAQSLQLFESLRLNTPTTLKDVYPLISELEQMLKPKMGLTGRSETPGRRSVSEQEDGEEESEAQVAAAHGTEVMLPDGDPPTLELLGDSSADFRMLAQPATPRVSKLAVNNEPVVEAIADQRAPSLDVDPHEADAEQTAKCGLPAGAHQAVLLRFVPSELCTPDMATVVIQQAGLTDWVVAVETRREKDFGQVWLAMTDQRAADMCIRHFHGRVWNTKGIPVTASLASAQDAAVPQHLAQDVASTQCDVLLQALLEGVQERPKRKGQLVDFCLL